MCAHGVAIVVNARVLTIVIGSLGKSRGWSPCMGVMIFVLGWVIMICGFYFLV
jgi:hypothetical protein